MQKGFLLYVRFNRNWTEVYGPFKSVRFDNLSKAGEMRPKTLGQRPVNGEFDMWHLAVPVADGEKLL